MSRQFTVALRVCLDCQRTFGVQLWPWSGRQFTRTHGLCTTCHRRLADAMEDERPVEGVSRVEALPPAA